MSNSRTLVATAVVVAMGCALAYSSGQITEEGLLSLRQKVGVAGSAMHVAFGSVLLAGALCVGQTRRKWLLWTAVGLTILSVAVQISYSLVTANPLTPMTWPYWLMRVGLSLGRTSTVVPAVVLEVTRAVVLHPGPRMLVQLPQRVLRQQQLQVVAEALPLTLALQAAVAEAVVVAAVAEAALLRHRIRRDKLLKARWQLRFRQPKPLVTCGRRRVRAIR